MRTFPDALSAAQDLTNRGYYCVSLITGSKASNVKDWPSKRYKYEELESVFHPSRDPGIGLLLGVSRQSDRCPVGADADVDDQLFITRVRLAIGPCRDGGDPPAKRGKKGLTYFAATLLATKGRHINGKDPLGKSFRAIDILGKGEQTVLPPSIHPETGEPYEWVGRSLHDVDLDDLPIIDAHTVSEIETAAKNPDSALFGINEMQNASDGQAGTAHNAVLAAVAVMVKLGWPDETIWRRVRRAAEYCGYRPPDNWEQKVRGQVADARAKGFDRPSGKGDPHVAAAEWFTTQWRGPDSVYNLDGAVVAYVDGHYDVLSAYNIRHTIATRCPIKMDGHSHWEQVHKTVVDIAPQLEIPEDVHRVCLRNGTVDLDTGQLMQWSRDDRLLTYLPFSYDSRAECPAYDAFMRETFAGDETETCVELFEEFAAYTLVPSLKYHKFLVLLGPPGSGKSMLLMAIQMIHGPDAYTAVPVDKFGDEKYAAHMVGKLVNLTGEISSVSRISDGFLKNVTAGDTVVVRHLYQAPMRVVLPTRIVMATNMVPRMAETIGIERRILILPCDNVVPKARVDPDLKKKLRAELPGILNRVLAGWRRLEERGHFAEPRSQVEKLEEFSLVNNHVLQWYRERTHQGRASVDDGYQLPRNLPSSEGPVLYSDFAEWSKFNGFAQMSSVTFGMRLSSLSPGLRPRVTSVGGNAVRVRDLTLVGSSAF